MLKGLATGLTLARLAWVGGRGGGVMGGTEREGEQRGTAWSDLFLQAMCADVKAAVTWVAC